MLEFWSKLWERRRFRHDDDDDDYDDEYAHSHFSNKMLGQRGKERTEERSLKCQH